MGRNGNGQLTVLVDEHSDADPGHVESVQEVLDAVVHLGVDRVRFFELKDALRHRLHHVRMPVANLHQCLAKPKIKKINLFAYFQLQKASV